MRITAGIRVERGVAAFLSLYSILMLFSAPAYAATIYLEDSFNDTSGINKAITTAEVDIDKGWVTLARKNPGNIIALYEDSFDVTVLNGTALETYQYNGREMQRNEGFSISSGLNDPVGVASVQPGECIVLDQGNKKALYYQYDGSSMVENTSLSVNGLNKPIAVGLAKDSYDYAVLDGQKINWYSFDGTRMVLNEILSLELGETQSPVSLSQKAGEYEYAVVDKADKSVKYYFLNDGALVQDLQRSIAAGELINPKGISLSSTEEYYLVLDDTAVRAYSFDGSQMVLNPFLSINSGLRNPFAVALKPGSYEYAVGQYDEDGNSIISYYAFDGNEMIENRGLNISGLAATGYGNDQVLMGKEILAGRSVWGLRLAADVELPSGTSIAWEVTVDGTTWLPITNNGEAVRFASPGIKPNYRAVLHTEDAEITPKILSVQILDASMWIGEFQITEIIGPSIPGNPELPTDEQVKIWAGYNVFFQINTVGAIEGVAADISFADTVITLSSMRGDLTPLYPAEQKNNTWQGAFFIDADVTEGTMLDIDFVAAEGANFCYVSYAEFAVVYRSALRNHPIHLTR